MIPKDIISKMIATIYIKMRTNGFYEIISLTDPLKPVFLLNIQP